MDGVCVNVSGKACFKDLFYFSCVIAYKALFTVRKLIKVELCFEIVLLTVYFHVYKLYLPISGA